MVQAAETLSISKENVTKINISEQTPEEVWGDMQINIVLDTPGTYLLEGSNYINESYIDTQITVPEGVEVNIILADGFSTTMMSKLCLGLWLRQVYIRSQSICDQRNSQSLY